MLLYQLSDADDSFRSYPDKCYIYLQEYILHLQPTYTEALLYYYVHKQYQ